jgi:stage II sporulation protein AA (anti-sigma F factor antagonist)
MELIRQKIEETNVVQMNGSLTVATAQDFFSQMVSFLEGGESNFVLEMSSVDFIDSTGLGTIVRLAKRVKEAKGQLRLSDPQPKILEIFELTRLEKILPIFKTQQEALEDLRK